MTPSVLLHWIIVPYPHMPSVVLQSKVIFFTLEFYFHLEAEGLPSAKPNSKPTLNCSKQEGGDRCFLTCQSQVHISSGKFGWVWSDYRICCVMNAFHCFPSCRGSCFDEVLSFSHLVVKTYVLFSHITYILIFILSVFFTRTETDLQSYRKQYAFEKYQNQPFFLQLYNLVSCSFRNEHSFRNDLSLCHNGPTCITILRERWIFRSGWFNCDCRSNF